MIILQLIVDNVNDLMTAGYTVIRVYTDTAATGTFVTLDGTETLVSSQESYEYEDADGTSATWYKTAYYGAGVGESSKSAARQGGTWSAYATLEDLKELLQIPTSRDDDVLLADMLDRASKAIDNYCGRRFHANTETRYFESDNLDSSANTLYLDDDLISVSTNGLVNGDSGSTVIPATEYWLIPRNVSPKFAIRLKSDSDYSWEWDTDYWVSVTGSWGWSSSPPLDIEQACLRLASYYYFQKDAPVFETTVFPESGIMTIPRGMPGDVKELLDPYRKRVG